MRRMRLNSDIMESIDTVYWVDLNRAQKQSICERLYAGDPMFSEFYDFVEENADEVFKMDSAELISECQTKLRDMSETQVYIDTKWLMFAGESLLYAPGNTPKLQHKFVINKVFEEPIQFGLDNYYISVYLGGKGLNVKAGTTVDVMDIDTEEFVFEHVPAADIIDYFSASDVALAKHINNIIVTAQRFITQIWNLMTEIYTQPLDFDFIDEMFTLEYNERDDDLDVARFQILSDTKAKCVYYPQMNI